MERPGGVMTTITGVAALLPDSVVWLSQQRSICRSSTDFFFRLLLPVSFDLQVKPPKSHANNIEIDVSCYFFVSPHYHILYMQFFKVSVFYAIARIKKLQYGTAQQYSTTNARFTIRI